MVEFEPNKEIEMIKQIRIEELGGLFKTSSAVPTHIPKKFSEQIVVYTSGSTYRLYWYDTTGGAWRYATGT
mgnify:CR=1 FL=1